MSPEQRLVFLREPPAFPVWLLIFLIGGLGAEFAGTTGWSWIGAAAVVALLRVLIAIHGLTPRQPSSIDSMLATLFISTHLAQAALWVLLLGAIGSTAHSSMQTATSLIFAMLLSAACMRGWRPGWLAAMAGWGAAAIGTAIGLWDSAHVTSIVLMVLLPIAAWAGLAPARSRPPTSPQTRVRRTTIAAVPIAGGSTRRGLQLAIHASSGPMIGVYDGRIFDLNRSAEAFLARTTDECIGRPVNELLRMDPASALDAAFPAVERHALVTPAPTGTTQRAMLPVKARIRMGRSGGHVGIAVVALTASTEHPHEQEPSFDARRLAEWLGADVSQAWYRDESGHLYVPGPFSSGKASGPQTGSDAFPLAPWVPPADRTHVNTLYRERLADGRAFDEVLTLTDAAGVNRSVRVTCLTRPGHGGQRGAAIGVVCQNEAGHSETTHSGATRAPRFLPWVVPSELPVLIWLIDAAGHVVHAHASDVQRWGLRVEPRLRPNWGDALALQPNSLEGFRRAVERALEGKPTFDLLNYRSGRAGGKMALRSHFVPFQLPGEGADPRAVLVMDTIASARELLENDRLRLSKAQYKELVEASPNLIWACDSSFRFTFVSRRASRDMYGRAVEELLGQPMSVLLDPGADQSSTRKALVGLRNGRALRDLQMAHRTKEGRHITVAVSAGALRMPDGTFGGAIGINVDVTTSKQREARLAEALRVERTVLDSAGQAIAVVKGGLVARCNDAFLHLLQMRPDELATTPVADLFAERSHWNEASGSAGRASTEDAAISREIRVRRSALIGEPEQFVWCQLTLRAVADGEYVVALANIDQIRRREADAHHDARHDELTGLPNRRLLSERVRAALATTALRNSGCAILVFDLDGFKPINDRYGHPAGDMVLREIAKRLQNVVRPQDTVARIGGDEFALLMPDCGSAQ
ncbi:MAG TPA: diguanylate cyclase, partial [Burkholderiaceae bacterium]|nr:diguanylate cyclase [Burkholderiaceae bacterium]